MVSFLASILDMFSWGGKGNTPRKRQVTNDKHQNNMAKANGKSQSMATVT
jgi:hypothetical protein